MAVVELVAGMAVVELVAGMAVVELVAGIVWISSTDSEFKGRKPLDWKLGSTRATKAK